MISEITFYLGYSVEATADDFTVIAPNGDQVKLTSMSAVRKWVKYHRRTHRV